jgi:hypothetical protein
MFSKIHTSNRSFHVQKLALEALQEIKYRWEALRSENEAIKAKSIKKFKPNFSK